MVKILDNADPNSGFNYRPRGGYNYAYDDNGNLIRDDNKQITNITYNYLNLPTEITFATGSSLVFTYDAQGNKLMKAYKSLGTGKTYNERYYIGGMEYLNSVSNSVRDPAQATIDMIPNAEGFTKYDANALAYKDSYILRDHLGNTRVVFHDKNGDGIIDASSEIVQVNAYYPFGLNHGANVNGANGAYKYQYNGKELDDDNGLNWNDYGARFYDPAIGRWNGVDPLADSYKRWSPYNYTKDNPIKYIDPDGMGVQTDYYNTKGKNVQHIEDGKNDKFIVLTSSSKAAEVSESISKGEVVAVPSNDVIKSMDAAYTATEVNGLEHGFVAATDGTVSSMKEGTPNQVKLATNYEEVEKAGKTSSYDVHTHPNEVDKKGNLMDNGVGAPAPSPNDIKSYGKDGPNDRPSVVLGYKAEKTETTDVIGGRTSTSTSITKQIGFYNSSGVVGKALDYNDFKKTAIKINKTQ